MKTFLRTLFNDACLNSKGSLLLVLFFGIINTHFLKAQDTDNDGVINLLDRDDDNDGISDITEGYGFYTDGTTTNTSTGNCTGRAYNFTGGTYISATGSGAGTLNAQYRFPNTSAGLDAIITIVQKSTSVTVLSLDQNLGDNNALQPVLRYATGSTGNLTIQLQVRFVLTGTNTSATVDRVGGFIQDIDSGSGVREFYRVQNIVGYSIGNPTKVITQNLGGGVIQFTADGTGSAPIEPIDIDNKYRIFFQKRDTNQFLFTIGGAKTSTSQVDRYYSIRFDECRIDLYTNPSHIFFNAPDTDNDTVPDYLDLDSDGDGCSDTIEAGYIDAYTIAQRDGKLGVIIPPQVTVKGEVSSGVNGQGYTLPQDLNTNGIWDFLESAISTPCNDHDGDGVPDNIDLDDDDDGIPDTVEGTNDSDGDGIPNYFDLDSDNDGISDVVEGGNGIFDTNNDGTINSLDIGFADSNQNGQADATEGKPVVDTDTDGIRDAIDLDADNDGIYDVVEGGNSSLDSDNNGTISTTGASPEDMDTNNNGWPDATEGTLPIDTGNNNSADYQNLDSDSDGCSDANEAYNRLDADGGDGGQYGTGNPAPTGTNGNVTAAAYDTGIVSAVTNSGISSACDGINAVDDDFSGSPIEGTTGGVVSAGNVLDNDTINGIVLNPANITLTSTPTSALTVNADGTVQVSPNTPTGTYTINYTICLTAVPANCDSATVTVVVANGVLDAVDDTLPTPIDGAVGGTGILNVLDNDTFSGAPVNPANISLTPVVNGPLTVNADGTVDIAPNTPAGTYTINYTICETAVPTNCDTATVSIEVANGLLDAVNDTVPSPVNGTTGGVGIINVLNNDTLDGVVVNPANIIVTSSTTGPLTVNSDGTLDVAPNTAAGTYTNDYTICETTIPSNCDTATVTVSVNNGLINAVDDSIQTPVNGTNGGTAVINVLDNDTLNGNAATTANVSISTTPTGPLTINTDGTVDVAPNTAAGSYTIDYTICQISVPANCDNATVTIVVVSSIITAVDDQVPNPVNEVDGAIGIINVLDNDTFNGSPVNPTTITLTSLPSGPLTINNDGTLDVAPNTPAGTYIIDYTICENSVPSNCDTGTAIVIVINPVLNAVDDDFTSSPIEGTTGGVVTAGSVLDNDTFNGTPLNPANIILSSVPTGPLTINPNGTVGVAANTTPGTYTIDYTICEKALPSNCDTATVTVTVANGVLDAVNDMLPTPVDGISGGFAVINVLDNDTFNGISLNPALVTLTATPTGPLTINSDGTVDVAPNTAAGSYTIDYMICEIALPTNCDTATATITVANGLLDAVDDDFTSSPVEGTTGGIVTAGSVLDNDTFDGFLVSSGNVILTATPTGPLSVDSEGTVYVSPNTAPGIYMISYTICELAVPTNCDTATVTVVVANGVLDAVDDTLTRLVDGVNGETAVLNILDNDTFNGLPVNRADITLTSIPGGPLTVNSDGTLDVAPNTAGGIYTIDYTICESATPSNCDTATARITVVNDVLDAVDDDFTSVPVDGTTGGVVMNANVLDNDTLNGNPITPSDIVLTSTPTGPLTVNTDGSVSVAPNTAAGTYSIDYTLCKATEPANCDTATVTILVQVDQTDDISIDNDLVSTDFNNDVFLINNIELYPNNTFDVYNRWGVLVFNTKGYNNGANAFRGFSNGRATINKNKGLPVGVYFYVLNYVRNGENKTLSGYLYVNR
jgi:hypothetical protein